MGERGANPEPPEVNGGLERSLQPPEMGVWEQSPPPEARRCARRFFNKNNAFLGMFWLRISA